MQLVANARHLQPADDLAVGGALPGPRRWSPGSPASGCRCRYRGRLCKGASREGLSSPPPATHNPARSNAIRHAQPCCASFLRVAGCAGRAGALNSFLSASLTNRNLNRITRPPQGSRRGRKALGKRPPDNRLWRSAMTGNQRRLLRRAGARISAQTKKAALKILARSRILLANPAARSKIARRKIKQLEDIQVGATSTENGLFLASVTMPSSLGRVAVGTVRDPRRLRRIGRAAVALALIIVIDVGPVGAVVDGIVQLRLRRTGRVRGVGKPDGSLRDALACS